MLKSIDALPDQDLRRAQIEEARRMAAQDIESVPHRPTLHVKHTSDARRPSPAFKRPAPANAPVKGHEAFLKALETSGAEIEVEKCDGTVARGLVKHSDKYTVTLRCYVDAPKPGADRIIKDRVIFKHDISEFSAITPRPAVPDCNTEEGHAV